MNNQKRSLTLYKFTNNVNPVWSDQRDLSCCINNHKYTLWLNTINSIAYFWLSPTTNLGIDFSIPEETIYES